jgi:nicotinate dehydrogenase subunit B
MLDALDRRQFLQGTGALVVSFALDRAASAQTPAAAPAKTVATDQVDGFLAIGGDGKVTVYSGKVDLGTGVRTALGQMVAEELDVPFARVAVVEGDTASTPDQGPTFGSLSIQNGGVQIRLAAATARQALLEMAAGQLGTPAGELAVRDGIVQPKAGGRGVGYGALIGGKSFALKLDDKAPLKDAASYTVVGKSVPRVDIPGKVTGSFTYMQDVRVPGMLHGRVVRPPTIGASLLEVDDSSVKGIPGLVKVVRQASFLGVVATSEWAAIRAARQLKATWSSWSGLPEQAKLYDHVRASAVAKDDELMKVGDAATALAQASRKFAATYEFPIHTHGSIGPSCAVAEWRDGGLVCWSASQATHLLRKQLATSFELPPEKVRVIYVDGSGCYGRNGHEDATADAALLARAVGRPVRVQWMREDEHGWDPKGPPTLIDLQAGLDASGAVVAWRSELWIPQSTGFDVPLVAASLAGLKQPATIGPGNVQNNAAIPYGFANAHVVAHRLVDTPLRPSWIRTPGRMQNTYANESFVDELAAAVKADPIEFRLRYLNDARGIETIKAAAARAKWETRASPKPAGGGAVATGRGFSYVKYELNRTYVAAVAEVEVDRASGAIRVTRFVVAHDCGLIVNPDGVRNQIEGNVIQTVSRTLKEELTFDRGRVTSLDWASYPILTFAEVPEIEIELIDRPKEKPWGAGEPSAAVIPSAISNAVFDALGVRLRTVPFTPERVKAAGTRAT